MITPLEEAHDADAIREITQQAFLGAERSSGTEGAIIDGLRAAGSLSLSLVAEDNGSVIGHVAFSPVFVDGNEAGWFGLGPVSMASGVQGAGTGSRLIREGLARLRSAGAGKRVVLGSPGYYRRFGFKVDPELTFDGAPPEYFMVLPFGDTTPSGHIAYQPAFSMT